MLQCHQWNYFSSNNQTGILHSEYVPLLEKHQGNPYPQLELIWEEFGNKLLIHSEFLMTVHKEEPIIIRWKPYNEWVHKYSLHSRQCTNKYLSVYMKKHLMVPCRPQEMQRNLVSFKWCMWITESSSSQSQHEALVEPFYSAINLHFSVGKISTSSTMLCCKLLISNFQQPNSHIYSYLCTTLQPVVLRAPR